MWLFHIDVFCKKYVFVYNFIRRLARCMYWLGICFPAGVRQPRLTPTGTCRVHRWSGGNAPGLSLTAPQTALELPRPVLVQGAAVTVLARAPAVHVHTFLSAGAMF